jgi:hypothetical protein
MEFDSQEYFDAVASELKKLGLDASTQSYGGGIVCVDVLLTTYLHEQWTLVYGTANDTWGADVYLNGEFQDGKYVETDEKITQNPTADAEIIFRSVLKFQQSL